MDHLPIILQEAIISMPETIQVIARRTSDNCTSAAASIIVQNAPLTPIATIASIIQQPSCSVSTGTVTITSSTSNMEFSIDGGTYALYPAGGYQLS